MKYLANATGPWVNEHAVRVTPGMDVYALIVYEAFAPVAVLVFPRDGLMGIGAALGKRHPNQDMTLQLTRRNVLHLLGESSASTALGVRIFLPPFTPAPLGSTE